MPPRIPNENSPLLPMLLSEEVEALRVLVLVIAKHETLNKDMIR
jgi:hypothetical protein